MAMIGRLKPGVSVSSAQADVAVLAGNITRAHPKRNQESPSLEPAELLRQQFAETL
jgi:hypothetical protein